MVLSLPSKEDTPRLRQAASLDSRFSLTEVGFVAAAAAAAAAKLCDLAFMRLQPPLLAAKASLHGTAR